MHGRRRSRARRRLRPWPRARGATPRSRDAGRSPESGPRPRAPARGRARGRHWVWSWRHVLPKRGWKVKGAAEQGSLAGLPQLGLGGPGIGGEPSRLRDLGAIQDILADRRRQGLSPLVHRLIIGFGPAIKGLAEGAHPLRHGLVADPYLAQIVVHILAE